ncbi:MAG: helix-turn-helix domain-containing protein [Phycisphaera sp.]|nr:helix-turn-helix domain-containing protein [Phycisphaera sp.]
MSHKNTNESTNHGVGHDHEQGTPRLALRADEAAKALGIGERLLWSLTASGEIPHARLGRAVVYPVLALQRWLDELARGADDER